MKVDIDELAAALEDQNAEISRYLDKETGEVVLVFDDFGLSDSENVDQEARNNPDRYVFIEPMDSSTGYRIMEDFVLELPDGPAKELLERALAWKKPFSNFKNALRELPELKEAWFKHHDARMRAEALEWLADHDIVADDPSGGKA